MSNLKNFAQNSKKIIGVTANYKKQLKIMNKPIPEIPEIFMKPSTSIISQPDPIIIPNGFSVNEEIELAVVIGKKGKNIAEKDVMDHVGGYCLALDMTATCQMTQARSTGGPWIIGKGFDTACPVSRFISTTELPDPNNIVLWCSVNGSIKQEENTNDLAISIPKLISYISKYFTLEPNDLIITGSPPGMGPVKPGDVIEGGIRNFEAANIKYIVKSE